MSTAAPRLLVSNLVRQCKPKTHTSVRQLHVRNTAQSRGLHANRPLGQEAYAQRYGSATQRQIDLPPPSSPNPEKPFPPPQSEQQQGDDKDTRNVASDAKQQQDEEQAKAEQAKAEQESTRQDHIDQRREYEDSRRTGTPLDIVLKTPPPNVQHENSKPPHLAPSPYVHHFDTYTLVRNLAEGGYTEGQAILIMKAVRGMLANNLDVARDGLVSKSDVENETYLFRAACSELRTSLQTSRHSEVEKQRSQRAHLQHENDILTQRVTQDMLSLREDLKGMFNDRKMAAQEEKRKLDAKIQQLNYEITVELNSDSKREVEGLRWVLTRRAVMAIAISGIMIILSLNYSSHVYRQREEAEKRQKAAREAAEKAQSEARYTTASTQVEGLEEGLA